MERALSGRMTARHGILVMAGRFRVGPSSRPSYRDWPGEAEGEPAKGKIYGFFHCP